MERNRRPRIIFKQLSSEDRNRTPQELFAIVEEAKNSLRDGSMTLKDCYMIMKKLSDTIVESRDELEKMFRIAEDLLYEAKC